MLPTSLRQRADETETARPVAPAAKARNTQDTKSTPETPDTPGGRSRRTRRFWPFGRQRAADPVEAYSHALNAAAITRPPQLPYV
jgi:hypothetical protein